MHLHTLYSDGTASVAGAARPRRASHRPRPHRDHRPRADRRGAARARDARGRRLLASASSSARRSPPGAATCWRSSSPSGSRRCGRWRRRIERDPRTGRHRDRRPPDGAAHPVARPPLAGRAATAADPRHRLDALELMNPSAAGRSRRAARTAAQRRGPRPGRRRQLRRPRAGGHRHRVDVVPRLERGRLSRGDRGTDDAPDGRYWSHFTTSTSTAPAARQARHLGHTLRPSGEWR